jgi:hypothetical protein
MTEENPAELKIQLKKLRDEMHMDDRGREVAILNQAIDYITENEPHGSKVKPWTTDRADDMVRRN